MHIHEEVSGHVLKKETISKNLSKVSCSWIPVEDTCDKHELSQKAQDVAPQFQEKTKGQKNSFLGVGVGPRKQPLPPYRSHLPAG